MGSNPLTLLPPVLPDGTHSHVLRRAPAMRHACPTASADACCRKAQRNIAQCTRTCSSVELWPSTWARSRRVNAKLDSPSDSCRAATSSSYWTNGWIRRPKRGERFMMQDQRRGGDDRDCCKSLPCRLE